MYNFARSRVARIATCRADLLVSGVDLAAAGIAQLWPLVREHLEYFQLALGDDSTAAQVVALVRREVRVARRRVVRAIAASGAGGEDQVADRLARRRSDMAHMTLGELAAMGREVRRRADAVNADLALLQESFELHARDARRLS